MYENEWTILILVFVTFIFVGETMYENEWTILILVFVIMIASFTLGYIVRIIQDR